MISSLFMGAAYMIVAISFASLVLPFAVERVQRRAEAKADKADLSVLAPVGDLATVRRLQ